MRQSHACFMRYKRKHKYTLTLAFLLRMIYCSVCDGCKCMHACQLLDTISNSRLFLSLFFCFRFLLLLVVFCSVLHCLFLRCVLETQTARAPENRHSRESYVYYHYIRSMSCYFLNFLLSLAPFWLLSCSNKCHEHRKKNNLLKMCHLHWIFGRASECMLCAYVLCVSMHVIGSTRRPWISPSRISLSRLRFSRPSAPSKWNMNQLVFIVQTWCSAHTYKHAYRSCFYH